MYERIKSNISEGSGLLPSILNISTQTDYNKDKYKLGSESSIYNGTVKSTAFNNGNFIYGSIGNFYGEYTIEFMAETNKMTENIKALNDSIVNNRLKLVSTDLESKFYIFQINDTSSQSMTMNNYDYFFKLFMTTSGETSKISDKAIAIIKSYTLKKAWVLLDRTIIKALADSLNKTIDELNITYSYILDYIYKFTKNETSTSYKFGALNNYSNIQSLFNNTKEASPYFDKFYINRNDNEPYKALNIQANYMLQSLFENYNTADVNNILKEKYVSTDGATVYKNLLRDSNLTTNVWSDISNDLDRFKMKIVSGENIASYLQSGAYEVYEYDTNSYFGKRKLMSATGECEVYPNLADMIHYIFNIGSITTTNANQIRKTMKQCKIYLYNYNFTNFNIFTENNINYLEVYIPMPYGKVNFIEDSVINAYTDNVLTTFDLVSLTNDERSDYDPSFLGQTAYTDTDNNSYYIPYFGSDDFVSPLLTNSNIRLYSNKMLKTDITRGNVFDTYFDIMASDTNVDTETNNKINGTTITNGFSTAGFRDNSNSKIVQANNFIKRCKDNDITIAKNLYKFFDINQAERHNTTSTTLVLIDSFFIYFELPELDNIEVIMTSSNNYDTRDILFSFDSYVNSDNITMYRYILPGNFDIQGVNVIYKNVKIVTESLQDSRLTYYKVY